MLISLDYLVKQYGIHFKGILHVGAHECEELNQYLRYVPIQKILWVEAIPEKVAICRHKHPGLLIETAIVSDVIEKVHFHIANNGQSSSILSLGTHAHDYPEIWYTKEIISETQLLHDILSNYNNLDFNFVNLDIQGAELKALQGMRHYLKKVDYLYTEVNKDYVYKNCALVGDMDEYLMKFGLYRVETQWETNQQWGDAFYIRKDVSPPCTIQ